MADLVERQVRLQIESDWMRLSVHETHPRSVCQSALLHHARRRKAYP